MLCFDEQIQKELDNLVNIAFKYREGDISESLFFDVMSKYIKDKEKVSEYKEYLLNKNVKVVSDEEDIEVEKLENDDSINIKPYDTKSIDISPKPLSLDIILDRLQNKEIDLLPDFQRKGGLWTNEQKSQLIESLILRIPLPAFYFDGSNSEMWIVIDGLQRLTALKEFFVDKTLNLTGLEFLKDLDGLGIDDMPRTYVRRMKETQIITYIINPGAPVNLKYNIFKRINTGGLKLEPQEIRHALYQGYATEFVKHLSQKEIFKEATGYSVGTDRMMDREFVLRFIAFYELDIDSYKGSIDFFLNSAMDYINKNYNDTYAQYVENTFLSVLKVCKEIFDKFAFRRMPDTEKRRPISKALFETWTSILAQRSNEDLQKLIRLKEVVFEKYKDMCANDKEFVDSIGSGKIYSVRKRFEKIKGLIEGVLNND